MAGAERTGLTDASLKIVSLRPRMSPSLERLVRRLFDICLMEFKVRRAIKQPSSQARLLSLISSNRLLPRNRRSPTDLGPRVVAAQALCPELLSNLPRQDVSSFQIAYRKTRKVSCGRAAWRSHMTDIGCPELLPEFSENEVVVAKIEETT